MNKTLHRDEMKALKPMRRTLTTDRKGNLLESPKLVVMFSYQHDDYNRSQRRAMANTAKLNNRKATRGRIIQYADVMDKQHKSFGSVLIPTGRIRKILHRAFHNFFK